MSEVNIIVSVDEAHLPEILAVAQALRESGVKVEQILDTVGAIVGSCDSQVVASLSQIEGVAAVEEERGFQLPPPDSEIQ